MYPRETRQNPGSDPPKRTASSWVFCERVNKNNVYISGFQHGLCNTFSPQQRSTSRRTTLLHPDDLSRTLPLSSLALPTLTSHLPPTLHMPTTAMKTNVDTNTATAWFKFPKRRAPRIPNSAPLATPRKEVRIPGIGYLRNRTRNNVVAFIGEFVGTFLFLFFAFSATQVANAAAAGAGTSGGSLSKAPNASTLLYISIAFGFSLAVNVWIFFRISGGAFNPAVTFGLALIGCVGWIRAAICVVAQILGATAASAVVAVLFAQPLNVSTTLGGEVSTAQGFFIEAFLTAELVFTIIMLAAERHKGTFMAPFAIGLSLFICELTGVYFTGGSLNPARSFGPCVVTHTFPNYHWIYWLGPLAGSAVAAMFFQLLKMLENETANPGADFSENEMERFIFDEENACTRRDVARPSSFFPANWEKFAEHRGQLPVNEVSPPNTAHGDYPSSPDSLAKLMSNNHGTHIETQQVMSNSSLPLSHVSPLPLSHV